MGRMLSTERQFCAYIRPWLKFEGMAPFIWPVCASDEPEEGFGITGIRPPDHGPRGSMPTIGGDLP
jgi:hypothetical protein